MRVKEAFANLLLSALSVLVFVGGVEGVCRLLESGRPAPRAAAYITDWNWEGDFYTVKSTAAGWPPWEDYNSDGLRDRERAVEKPTGVRRLICLGDSTTLGWGIRPQEAYPQVLQDLLESMGERTEVFNVALGGWSTRQELIAYRRIARKYRPDEVLIGVCLNDVPEMQNNLSRPPAWLAALHERSALVRRLVRAQDREIADVEELFSQKDSPKVREAFARMFADMRVLRDEVRADGATFAVLIFPFRLQVLPGAPPPTAQQTIVDFCRSAGIPVLDLLPALRPAGESAFIDYDHFSPAGARLVAEQILASGLVVESGPLPPRDTPASLPPTPSPALPALLLSLRSGNERSRIEAARALGELGAQAKGAESALITLLDDPSPRVRVAATWAVARLRPLPAAALAGLIRRLQDPAPGVRAGAARALGEMGEAGKPALLPLVERLRDEDETVRARAGESLAEIGPDTEGCRRALVSVLADPAAPGRAEAAGALGRLGPGAVEAVPVLSSALEDKREAVRARAAWALGEIGPGAWRAVPALLAAFRDPGIRWRVADALGGIGPGAAAAVPALLTALKDDSSNVRWRSIQALGRIGPPAGSAAPALVAALGDPGPNVRLGALTALAQIGADPALLLSAHERVLADPDTRVRSEAVNGLGRMGPRALPAAGGLAQRLRDEDPGVRARAARALGRLGRLPPAAVAALGAARSDPDGTVRDEAEKALRKAGGE
ncbi:MAG TPA: HEAT repeat domain-containing protein [Vicinamibacteria bacterium]|nr:HEAT repeat domain-containing protein [Vicinamibacteria bacterium]